MGYQVQAGKLMLLLALLGQAPGLAAQNPSGERRDSLVRLIKGSSLQLIEKGGRQYRKAVDATFLHNGSYLICDTALWDVGARVINAMGNVRLVQDETILSSDKLDYLIDDNLVQFRGSLVQLQDKDRNTLRTRYLDYNTRDSVALFRNGGAMRDKDGQIIESLEGSYDSRRKLFSFRVNVNMFTDSVFVKTTLLDYESMPGRALFQAPIDFWKDGNMLSAAGGWYDRPAETFFFTGNVHAMSRDQEAWSDSLYFYRVPNDVLLLGRAQVQDTTRNVAAVAGRIFYQDSISRVTLSRDAAVALRTGDGQKDSLSRGAPADTVFFGADTLVYQTFYRCALPDLLAEEADVRLKDMMGDPVTEYRRKAAQQAAEAAAQAAEAAAGERPPGAASAPARPGGKGPSRKGLPGEASPEGESAAPDKDAPSPEAPGQSAPADSLAAPADSLHAPLDTLPPLPDSTRIGFLDGFGKVKIFREDIQVRCDSMRYCDLDSIARFYIDPVVWNDGNRQYSADSLFVLVRGNGVDRANLMSGAFIITQEDSLCFDQIRATEVMAYFDSTSALRRFDALGGATALFFLKEKESFATVNKVESKMLSALFKEGDLDRVFYFDSPKNDAWPLAQMPREDRTLKGFNWRPDERPRGRFDITDLKVRPSQRSSYSRHPRTTFAQTDIYFPGYMKEVYRGIELRDSLKRAPRPEAPDTLAAPGPIPSADSLAAVPAPADSLKQSVPSAPADTLAAASDSLRASADSSLAGLSERARLRAERAEARRKAREARWAELDARDAAKAEAKAQKALERKRERMRRAVLEHRRQEARDRERLERYIRKYEARAQRRAARKKDKPKSEPEHGSDS